MTGACGCLYSRARYGTDGLEYESGAVKEDGCARHSYKCLASLDMEHGSGRRVPKRQTIAFRSLCDRSFSPKKSSGFMSHCVLDKPPSHPLST